MYLQSTGTGHLRFWRPLPRTQADVICGEGVVAALPLHAHEAWRVVIPASRFTVVDGRGQAVVVRPGLVHWAAPLELEWVRGVDGAPCAMWVLLLPPALLATAEPASDGRDGTSAAPASACSGLVDDPALYARLCASVDELRRPLAPVDCVGRLRECVAALVTRREDPRCSLPSSTRRQHAGLARVGAHLREHVAEDVSLDELAELAGLSKFYLLRAFAREHGVTPRAYQMLLRAARAWRLIGEGLSLSRAAYDTGFADQSHLTRRFAELYGVTPGRWARLLAVPPGSLPVGAPILGHGAASSSAA